MHLVEMVLEAIHGNSLSQIRQAIGANELATSQAITAAVPALISGLANKARETGGAGALLSQLTAETESNILDNVPGYLANPTAAGGEGLLRQLLGDRQSVTEARIARLTGLSEGAIGRLLPLLAPMVMGAVARVVQTQSLDAAGLTTFLRDEQGFIRSSAPGLMGFLERIDANDDGSIMDDLGRLAGRLIGRR
jgi:hypothetical protein